MESAVRHQYDAALALQAIGSSAVTATAAGSNKIDLYRLTAGRGDLKNRYGLGKFDIVVHVGAVDSTTGDEAYTLQLCTYDANGANETVQESIALTGANANSTLEFEAHPDTMAKFDADAALFGVKMVCAGTTPSIAYWAFASQDTH